MIIKACGDKLSITGADEIMMADAHSNLNECAQIVELMSMGGE